MFMVPPLSAERFGFSQVTLGSSVTLCGHDNSPGMPSPKRNLTGTDSKIIQSYLRAQCNFVLIMAVADAEIAVQRNRSY